MEDNKLLEQIAEMFQQQNEMISKKFESIDKKFEVMDEKFEELDSAIKETRIQIENDVTKRIESLFDGYKLVHEKQWDLERRCDKLEQRLAELEKKVS